MHNSTTPGSDPNVANAAGPNGMTGQQTERKYGPTMPAINPCSVRRKWSIAWESRWAIMYRPWVTASCDGSLGPARRPKISGRKRR